jgi:hypothetical protein
LKIWNWFWSWLKLIFLLELILPLKLEFKGKKLIRYEIINSSYSLKDIINYKL